MHGPGQLVQPAVCYGDGIKGSFGGIGQPIIVQELCESRGGRHGLSVLTSHLVSVDVKLY